MRFSRDATPHTLACRGHQVVWWPQRGCLTRIRPRAPIISVAEERAGWRAVAQGVVGRVAGCNSGCIELGGGL